MRTAAGEKALATTTGGGHEAGLVQAPDMSLAVAEALLQVVKQEAGARDVRLAAAVVDRGGNLVASIRMDLAQLGACSLALDKAVTAVSFGHPTRAWATTSAPGGSDWGLAHTLQGRAIVFPGGVPVFAGSELVGALGVSGAASDVDEGCAEGAVDALGLRTAPVT
jgi:glc operon protein GlcG